VSGPILYISLPTRAAAFRPLLIGCEVTGLLDCSATSVRGNAPRCPSIGNSKSTKSVSTPYAGKTGAGRAQDGDTMGRRDPDMMLLDPGADLTAMERAHPDAARAYKKHVEAASKMGVCMYCKGALSPPQANWAWVEMTDTLTSVSALCFNCIGKMGGGSRTRRSSRPSPPKRSAACTRSRSGGSSGSSGGSALSRRSSV
jgi:hypothetical protein